MEELREISKKLNETVEELKADKNIGKTVDELHEIRDKLKKIIKENGTIKKEKEIARAISYSQHYVEQLIQVLLRNQVTPMTMIEIIDEYITKEGLSA